SDSEPTKIIRLASGNHLAPANWKCSTAPRSSVFGVPAPVGNNTIWSLGGGMMESAHLPSGDNDCAAPDPSITGGEPSVGRKPTWYENPESSPSSPNKICLPSGEMSMAMDQSFQESSRGSFSPAPMNQMPSRSLSRDSSTRPSREMSSNESPPAAFKIPRVRPLKFTA